MFSKLKKLFNSSNYIELFAPVKGTVIPIENVNDPTFSEKMVGDGVAIIPDDNTIYSPVDGDIVFMFETGHAVNIRSVDGAEILVHIGLDTIRLKGEHFKILKSTGDKVKIGDPLIEFDREAIKEAGYDVTTPVIVANMDAYKSLTPTEATSVNKLDLLFTLELN